MCMYVYMYIYVHILTILGFRRIGTPEVNDYPFTTRGVSIGHIIVDQSVTRDAVKFQVMVRYSCIRYNSPIYTYTSCTCVFYNICHKQSVCIKEVNI